MWTQELRRQYHGSRCRSASAPSARKTSAEQQRRRQVRPQVSIPELPSLEQSTEGSPKRWAAESLVGTHVAQSVDHVEEVGSTVGVAVAAKGHGAAGMLKGSHRTIESLVQVRALQDPQKQVGFAMHVWDGGTADDAGRWSVVADIDCPVDDTDLVVAVAAASATH